MSDPKPQRMVFDYFGYEVVVARCAMSCRAALELGLEPNAYNGHSAWSATVKGKSYYAADARTAYWMAAAWVSLSGARERGALRASRMSQSMQLVDVVDIAMCAQPNWPEHVLVGEVETGLIRILVWPALALGSVEVYVNDRLPVTHRAEVRLWSAPRC